MTSRRFAALALLIAVTAAADVPSPTLEGPVTGGSGSPFIASTTFDLASVGYMREEFFVSGTATAYTSAAALGPDGKWTVTPGATAAYRTRVLAYRPINAKQFNGTVIVEWLNVSGGLDAAADWLNAHTELMRAGAAWLGVSAQAGGVEGGGLTVGLLNLPLKTVDPARYGTLHHPGDNFSYDIFSQAGQAIRHPAGASPFGTLRVKRLIATGESQSAFRLVTYINAVHPLDRIYDGFLVHSRSTGGAPLSEAPQPAISTPRPTLIRDDLRVPVLTFQTESDLLTLGFLTDRQDDSARFRLWEVAGTAHVDTYTGVGMTDVGTSSTAADLVVTTAPVGGFIMCPVPVNSGPQHFVLNAAFHALDRWVRHRTPPPRAPRIETSTSPPAIMRDAHGNALGGIRTPSVDVPIATLSGVGQPPGSLICALFGTTTPFDATTLASLYPDHATYVAAYKKAIRRALRAGFILGPDAKLMKASAEASSIGG